MIWFYFHFIILLFDVVTLRDVSFDTNFVLNAHLNRMVPFILISMAQNANRGLGLVSYKYIFCWQ